VTSLISTVVLLVRCLILVNMLQYEGAVNEGRRGPTIWDTLTRRPGEIMRIMLQ
jgi:hypothetical protein